jgi:hypothetical protein
MADATVDGKLVARPAEESAPPPLLEQSKDLVLTPGQTFGYVFGGGYPWEEMDARLRVTQPYNGRLVIELTAFLEVVGGSLRLEVPGRLISTLPRESRWQLTATYRGNPDDGVSIPTRPGRLLVVKALG